MPKIIENRLIEEFKDREFFSRNELFDFFRYFEPDLKEGTLGWRIYDLKNKNIIKPVRRGFYTISYKPKYNPGLSGELIKIGKLLSGRFKDVKHCIWETDSLNEFSQHQASKRMILIEIEKDFVESVYYELKDKFRFEIFLNPGEKAIEFYIAESNKPVILKNLITRSPVTRRTSKRTNIYTPLLEKILVDLFAEEKLFYFFQGRELTHIYENALQQYTVDFTKLFSYAKRRGKAQEIEQFMTNHMYHLVKDYIE